MRTYLLFILVFASCQYITGSCIVFVSQPDYGHFLPLIALAKQLKVSNECVKFASFEENGIKYELQKANISFINLGKFQAFSEQNHTAMQLFELRFRPPIEVARLFWNRTFAPMNLYLYQKLHEFLKTIKVEVFVLDYMAIGALIYANDIKVNAVVNHAHSVFAEEDGFLFPKQFSGNSFPMGFSHSLNQYIKYITGEYNLYDPAWPEMAHLRRSLDESLPIYPDYKRCYNLYNTFFGLEYIRPVSPKTILTGPLLDGSMGEPANMFNVGSDNIIYVNFGTVFAPDIKGITEITNGLVSFLNTFTNYSVVWRIKKIFWTHILRVPQRLFLVDWIDQNSLLRMTAVKVVLCHAGFNTIQEALLNGKPLLLLPIAWDQFDNAIRVKDSGAGLILPSLFSSTNILNLLTTLVEDKEYERSAQRLAILSKLSGGVNLAANVIKQTAELQKHGFPCNS